MATVAGLVCLAGAAVAAVAVLCHSLWAALPVFVALKVACALAGAALFVRPRVPAGVSAAYVVLQGAAGVAAVAELCTTGAGAVRGARTWTVLALAGVLPAAALAVGVLAAVGGAAYAVRVPLRDASDLACRLLHRTRAVRGQHVFITGGATGLGKALAAHFLADGATVTLASRSRAHLDAAAAELCRDTPAPPSRVRTVVCDVTDPASIHSALGGGGICSDNSGDSSSEDVEAEEIEVPDIVVTCAGLAHPARFAGQCAGSDAAFRREMELNYYGTLNVVRAVVPRMVARGRGSLVLVSSTLGMAGCAGYAAYAASKYAVRGLADSLRLELAPHGIDVHVVFPSNMVTPGFAEELRTKPPEARLIDERGHNMTAAASARYVYARLVAGDYAICNNGDLDALYMSAASTTPAAAPVTELLMAPVVWLAIGLERHAWEACVTKVFRAEHPQQQQQQQQH